MKKKKVGTFTFLLWEKKRRKWSGEKAILLFYLLPENIESETFPSGKGPLPRRGRGTSPHGFLERKEGPVTGRRGKLS